MLAESGWKVPSRGEEATRCRLWSEWPNLRDYYATDASVAPPGSGTDLALATRDLLHHSCQCRIDGSGYPFLALPLNDVSNEKANLGFISVSFPLMMGIVAVLTELSSGAMAVGGVFQNGASGPEEAHCQMVSVSLAHPETGRPMAKLCRYTSG